MGASAGAHAVPYAAVEAVGVRLAGFVLAGPGGAGAVILMAGLAEASYRKSESA